ncbi:hypothetical protein L873DRAFT_1806690 [Choiromyces venosus 120613-1]|uniref:F-box domain-containing protein n=1 Tax=Choiromyces venosus 120613-1 TaxID=1336337 RepID=A0A3N4JQC7_9PEZI|nr:hypothetical protein L873DRAFT_1806690 [Choiromyces venosus 120613-1]
MLPFDDPASVHRIGDTSTTLAHQLSEFPSLPATSEQNGTDTDPAEMDQQPPISHLPPELLVRILTFVGLGGGPSALRSCLLVCRGFYEIIEDPALDRHIYKAAAFSLLSYDPLLFPPPSLSGTRVPPSPITPSTQKQTYKVLARNLFLSRQPFPHKIHHKSTTCVPEICPTTLHGPNYVKRDGGIADDFHTTTLPGNEMIAADALPPLSVDPAGRKVVRIIDFVHSCTEASRTFNNNTAYVGVKTCGWSDSLPPGSDTTVRQGETASWILFSDDPRNFSEWRRRDMVTVQRAAIVGGSPPDHPDALSTRELQEDRRMEDEEAESSKLLRAVEANVPSSPVELSLRGVFESPFIRPSDHDKFINCQRRGSPEKSIYASMYKEFGPQSPKKKHESKDQRGQYTPPQGPWLTSDMMLWVLDNVADVGLTGFGKSLLHSDANLRLVPRLVKKQVEVAAVERLAIVPSDKDEVVVNMKWEMPKSIKDLSLNPADDLDSDEGWDYGVGEVKVCWEFRSCGAYLIVSDDNSGCHASTISCFAGRAPEVSNSSGKPSPPTPVSDIKWQRRMVVKPSVSAAEYWLDNDGLAINASVCAYSTRRHVMPATNSGPEKHRAVMEFHLLSLQTGDTVKILNLAEEERDINRHCYMWCSFTLGDGVLVASLGGLGSATGIIDEDGHWDPTSHRRQYGYENVFVWGLGSGPGPAPDLTPVAGPFRGDIKGEVHMTRPTSLIPAPQGWGDVDKYLVLSGCGRYLGITADWKTAVWDLEERSFVGVWRAKNRHILDDSILDLAGRSELPAWNGLWIKWRDVTYPNNSSNPIPVASGMAYINARELRCAVGGVERGAESQWIGESDSVFEGDDSSTDEESDEESNYITFGEPIEWTWLGGPPALQEDGEASSSTEAPAEAPLAEAPEDLVEALGSDGGDVGYMGWAH